MLQAYAALAALPDGSTTGNVVTGLLISLELVSTRAREIAEDTIGDGAPTSLTPLSVARAEPSVWELRTQSCPSGGTLTSVDTGTLFSFTASNCAYSSLMGTVTMDGVADILDDTGGTQIDMDVTTVSIFGAEATSTRIMLEDLHLTAGGGACIHNLSLVRGLLNYSVTGALDGGRAGLVELSDAMSQMSPGAGDECTWAFGGRYQSNARVGDEPATRHDVTVDTLQPLRYMPAPGAGLNFPIGGQVAIRANDAGGRSVLLSPDVGGVSVVIDGVTTGYLTRMELEARLAVDE
jgi:hypothetical protein